MGKLIRRSLAFFMGMIFGFTALASAFIGGAYWAYKNVKPVEVIVPKTVEGLGEVESASIEDLLNLVSEAVESPDEYNIARLEKQYGLNLTKLLNSVGIDTTDTSSVDVDALKDVSLFNLADGTSVFLDGIKLRALYVFFPKLFGKKVDDILSLEAQNKLGEYSIFELLATDETTGEQGIVSALKNLKLGSVLPTVFDSNYSSKKHEFTYTVKEDCEYQMLDVLGNVYIGTIFDLSSGSDLATEIMDGGLSSIGDRKLSDIISLLVSTKTQSSENITNRTKVFGDIKVRDLFEKADGAYKLTYSKLLSNLQLGYALGYYRDSNNAWFSDESFQTPINGIALALANANLKDILENKNNTLSLLNAAFGDLTIQDIIETFGVQSNIPEGLKCIYSIRLSSILNGETGNLKDDLMSELSKAFSDTTLGELLGKTSDNAALNSVYSIKVGQLLTKGITQEAILNVIQQALNGVSIGDLLGYERNSDGTWVCDNQYLGVFLDLTFGEAPSGISVVVLASLFSDGSVSEMFKSLFGDINLGNLFSVVYKYTYDESADNWFKLNSENEMLYLDQDFAKVLKIKLWEFAASFDKKSDVVISEPLKGLSVGEALFSFLQASNKLPESFIKIPTEDFEYIETAEDGYIIHNEDSRQISEILFQLSFDEIYEHRDDKQHWLDLAKRFSLNSVLGMFLTDEQENSNAFLKASLTIELGELLEVAENDPEKNSRIKFAELIEKYYSSVEINGSSQQVMMSDLFRFVLPEWQKNCTLNTIGSLKFSDCACALLGKKAKREVFGQITLNDLFGGYVPQKYANSTIIVASLGINLNSLADYYYNRNLPYLLEHVLEPQYSGLTVMDCVDDFASLGEKLNAFNPVLQMQMSDLLAAFRTKNYGTILQDFRSGFSQLDKTTKTSVLGALAGVGVVLYKIDNATLVKLVSDMFGEETWSMYLSEPFGFKLDGDNYLLNGVYNPVINKLFKQEIRITLDKTKCDLKTEYLNEITLGVLATSHKKINSSFIKLADKFKMGELAFSSQSQIYLMGDFENASKKLLNIKLVEIYENRANLSPYIKTVFDELLVGDVLAIFFKKIISKSDSNFDFECTADGYTVKGSFVNIFEKLFNMKMTDFYSNPSQSIKDIINDGMIGDVLADTLNIASQKSLSKAYAGKAVLSEDKQEWLVEGNYDEVLSRIYNLKLRQTLEGFNQEGKTYLSQNDVLGTLVIGNFFAKGENQFDEENGIWLDSEGQPIDFSGANGAIKKRLYSLSFNQFLAEGFTVNDVIADIYIGELLNYSCQNQIQANHQHTDACIWQKPTQVVVFGEDANGVVERAVNVDALEQGIASLRLNDLFDGGFSIQSIFGEKYLGDLIGMSQKVQLEDGELINVWYKFLKTEEGNYIVDENSQKLIDSVSVSKLNQTLCSIQAKTLVEPHAIEEIMNKIKALKIGDVLEYSAVEELDEFNNPCIVWYKKDVNGDLEKVSGIMQQLANETISALEGNFNEIVEGWGLGDVLGYTKDSRGVWYNGENEVKGVMRELSEYSVGYIKNNFSDIVNSWEIGNIVEYNARYFDGLNNQVDQSYQGEDKIEVWYNGDEVVTGPMQKLAGNTVGEIKTDFKSIINSWTLEDVLDSEIFESNPILNAVKGVELSNISNAINQVEIGEAMGLERKADNKWYNSNGTIVSSEVTLILADYKIGHITNAIQLYDEDNNEISFADSIIEKMLNEVSVGTFFADAGTGDGVMAFLDPSWSIGEIPQNLTNEIKNAEIERLILLGVFGDFFNDTANYQKIDLLFVVVAPTNTRDYWLGLSMSQFMTAILIAATT